MRYEIKELGLGGILDQAITLIKNHFGLLIGVAFCFLIPFWVASGLAVPLLMPDFMEMQQRPPGAMTPEQAREMGERFIEALPVIIAVVAVGILLLFAIVMPVTNGATIHALSQAYLGGKPSVGGAIGFAFKRLPSLLWTNLLSMIMIVLGLFLLIIPGVILMFRYFLVSQVVVIEGKSGRAALKRSGVLMKGHAGKVFVLGFLLGIIGALVGSVAGIIPVPQVSTVVSSVLQGVLGALGASAWTVLYFSARCKHEGFDLTRLAESLSQGPPPEDLGATV